MDINQEIQSAMPAVMERIKRETLQRIERDAVEAATQVAVQAAKEWAVENLVPEIKAQLEAGKSSIFVAAKEASEAIGQALGKAMAEQVGKSIANTHTLGEIVQKMFRGY